MQRDGKLFPTKIKTFIPDRIKFLQTNFVYGYCILTSQRLYITLLDLYLVLRNRCLAVTQKHISIQSWAYLCLAVVCIIKVEYWKEDSITFVMLMLSYIRCSHTMLPLEKRLQDRIVSTSFMYFICISHM